MQFSQSNTSEHVIESYQPGKLIVAGIAYSDSVIIDTLSCQKWSVTEHSQIHYETLRAAFAAKPDVIIIGTGEKQHFPPAEIYLPMLQHGIGIEIMDSFAAARTFNVLLSEARRVTAAIIV